MAKYSVIVLSLTIIFVGWIIIAKYAVKYMRQKGYRIKRLDIILLIALCGLVVLALIYTFIQTNGSFVWR